MILARVEHRGELERASTASWRTNKFLWSLSFSPCRYLSGRWIHIFSTNKFRSPIRNMSVKKKRDGKYSPGEVHNRQFVQLNEMDSSSFTRSFRYGGCLWKLQAWKECADERGFSRVRSSRESNFHMFAFILGVSVFWFAYSQPWVLRFEHLV